MKPDYKLVAKAKYIHMTADLASEVWHEVYKRYFPAKQLDALVDSLQSADSIEEDIDNDVNYSLGPAESEGGIERNELIFERML